MYVLKKSLKNEYSHVELFRTVGDEVPFTSRVHWRYVKNLLHLLLYDSRVPLTSEETLARRGRSPITSTLADRGHTVWLL